MRPSPHHLSRVVAAILLLPSFSEAHSFGTSYVLPIPLWMYVFACSTTLVLTFLVLALSDKNASGARYLCVLSVMPEGPARCVVLALRGAAVASVVLTILAGFIGVSDADHNIGMTLFWVVFLLILAYLTTFFGDLYSLVNPWKLAISGLQNLGLDLNIARVSYPEYLGYWPAFSAYVAIVWLELFGGQDPVLLSVALIVYTVVTAAGVALFGKHTWFGKADVFSVLFRLIALLAPLNYHKLQGESFYEVELRPPLGRLPDTRTAHVSLVLFVLFMLASTAYDSIHDTVLWTSLFWSNALALFQPLWGADLGRAQEILMRWYLLYRQAGLLVFPFLYLSVYALVILWVKAWTKTTDNLSVLGFKFCFSMIPIGLANNAAHYFTLLVSQCRALPALVSDPFGLGWRLLYIERGGTQVTLPLGLVWHTEVTLILVGHAVSVYLTHRTALCELPKGRALIVGQIPLLAMTMIYTTVSLWIISLPIR